MRHTPGLGHIVLGLLLTVMCVQPAEWYSQVWDERLVPPARGRQFSGEDQDTTENCIPNAWTRGNLRNTVESRD